jgi:hypothetical protein
MSREINCHTASPVGRGAFFGKSQEKKRLLRAVLCIARPFTAPTTTIYALVTAAEVVCGPSGRCSVACSFCVSWPHRALHSCADVCTHPPLLPHKAMEAGKIEWQMWANVLAVTGGARESVRRLHCTLPPPRPPPLLLLQASLLVHCSHALCACFDCLCSTTRHTSLNDTTTHDCLPTTQ